MRVKKLGLIFGILLLMMFSLAFISSANECVIKSRQECNGAIPSIPAGKIILGLSAASNAHGELYNQTNYNNVLCCNFGDGIQANECSSGAQIVKLSSTTNAHAEISSGTSYSNGVCYQSTGFSCQTITSGSCQSGYNSLLSLSTTTNAHIGSPGDYAIKICCNVGNGGPQPITAYWSNTSTGLEQINSSIIQINDNVYSIGKNLDSYIGQSLTLRIWENDHDSFIDPDELVKTAPVIPDSNGDISYTWTITQADWEAGNDFNEGATQEFYFEIAYYDPIAEDERILITSDDLLLSLGAGLGTPTAYWSDSSSGNQINSVELDLGTTPLYMIIKNSGLSDGNYPFQIYERDSASDDDIRTTSLGNAVTGTVSGGNASILVILTQEDWNRGYTQFLDQEANSDEPQEHYFTVQSLTSNELNTSKAAAQIVECLNTNFCSDYAAKSSCEVDSCSVGPDSVTPPGDGVTCDTPGYSCFCGWNSATTTCEGKWSFDDTSLYCGDSKVSRPNEAFTPIDEQCDPDEQTLPDGTPNPDGAPVFLETENSCVKLTQNLGMDTYTGGSLGCTGSCTFNINSCLTTEDPECGNNVIDQNSESCDGTDFGTYTNCESLLGEGATGTLGCNVAGTVNECQFYGCTPPTGGVCGDGNTDAGEQCDDGNTISGDGCSYPSCENEPPLSCNNNDIAETGEFCDDTNGDGIDLNGESCTTQGFDTGQLLCDGCGFDTIQCTNIGDGVCGDGNTDAGEQCDDGNTISDDGCSYPSCENVPPLSCNNNDIKNDGEFCDDTNGDGIDLNGESCTTQGFDTGQLLCDSCGFDTIQCVNIPPFCGDGNIDTPNSIGRNEYCDGTNLPITTCAGLNSAVYASGNLACNPLVCTYNLGQCVFKPGIVPECGDGVLNQISEECDGIYYSQGHTCTSLGFDAGDLRCTTNCKIDSSQCDVPATKSGSCQITQDTTDDCSDGFLSFSWTGIWVGDEIIPQAADCRAGGEDVIQCPAQIQLPFFSAYNIVAIAVLAILIYFIISLKKNKKARRKR